MRGAPPFPTFEVNTQAPEYVYPPLMMLEESYWEIVPGACNAAGQNLARAIAGQYGPFGISFVAVNPGPVRTERRAGLVATMARDMRLPHAEADQLAPRSIPAAASPRSKRSRTWSRTWPRRSRTSSTPQ